MSERICMIKTIKFFLPSTLFTANEIEHDLDAQAEDCYIAMEVLCEV